jgi:uncharacterized C2H2 Zn-finger protein
MQRYAAFDRIIEAFCSNEKSLNDSIPERLREGYLKYLEQSTAEEVETSVYGLSPLHRLQQMLKSYSRAGSNLSLRRLLKQMRSESEAESKDYLSCDETERAYKICLNVAAVVETLAGYLETNRESLRKDFSSLYSQIVDLENDIQITLEPEQEVSGTTTGSEHMEPDNEPILIRIITVLPELGYLIKDLEQLLKDWTRYETDPSIITEIRQRLWQRKEQFRDLISNFGNLTSSIPVPGVRHLETTISEVASTLNPSSFSRTTAEASSKTPEQLSITSVEINRTAKASLPHISSTSNKVSKSERDPKLSTEVRPFACIFRLYGCGASFTSKNEWKRHINGLHMRSEIWRCDIDTCAFQDQVSNYSLTPLPTPISTALTAQDVIFKNQIRCVTRKRNREGSEISQPHRTSYRVPNHQEERADPVKRYSQRGTREKSRVEKSTLNTTLILQSDPQTEILTPHASSNEYNRKDAFARHLRRVHYPDLASEDLFPASTIKAAQERCHVKLRELPIHTNCPFCASVFRCWEDKLEHIANHLEGKEKLGRGKEDIVLKNWMIKEAFLERRENKWRLCELKKKQRIVEKSVSRFKR